MALREGQGVRAKSGKHKGKLGHVHRDVGTKHVYHVMFGGYGLSYQPGQNLDPDHDGDVDVGDTDRDTAAWTKESWEAAMARVVEIATVARP